MDGHRKNKLIGRFKLAIVVLFAISVVFYIWSLFPSGKIAQVPLIGRQLQGYYLIYQSKTATNINDKNRLQAIGNALINNQTTFEYKIQDTNFQPPTR